MDMVAHAPWGWDLVIIEFQIEIVSQYELQKCSFEFYAYLLR